MKERRWISPSSLFPILCSTFSVHTFVADSKKKEIELTTDFFYFECSWWTQLGLSLYMNLNLSLTRRNWWRLLYLYVVAWIYNKWGYFCTLAALKLALLPEYNCQNKTPVVAAISGLYLVIGGQMASCLAGTGAITAWSHRSAPWCAYPRQ